MRRGGYKTWLLPAIFVIAAGEFMLDLATPLGVSDWLLYFIPLLLSSYVGSRHFPYLLAGLFSMLNLAGFYLSASGGVNPNYAIIGRLIGIGAFWVTALIISRFKANEEKLRLTDRALKTISECDKALVRATSEPALLQEICRVIVEQGGYRLAWVGFAENDADKTVRFAARAGCDEGYLEQARITWADTERGRGPTGTAIRTGRIVACNNMLTDPLLAFWREAARQRGFHSSIVLPLQNAGKTFGVLTLYAGQINAFQSPEIELLKELTDDLAFGIHALRTRAEHQQAEQTLQESEQKYRSIFDQAQLGIFQSTLDGRLISVNDAAAVMAGFESPAAMVQATNDIAAQHFANSDQRPEIVQAACQSDKSVQRELEFRRRDGTPFPVSLHMRAVRGPNGEVKFLEGFVEDITWRREAEKRLRESEQKYRGIVEQSPLGIYQSTVDGRLTSVNPALVAIFGFASAEEMMLASDNLSAQRFVHAGQRQEIVRAACQSETSVQREVEYRRKDGTPFPANLHMRAIRGPAGEIIALEGYVEDISQRKQSELALQQTERSYREIFNAANDAIFIHDADTGAVLDVNESMLQLYGFSREEALRLTAEDGSQGISPYSAAEARQWMIKAINEGPQVFEWHSRKKSGELFWVEVALKHADIGGQRRLLAIVRDITDRKRNEEALQHTNTRIRHLNHVLHAIQEVSKLLNREKNAGDLLTAICRSLVKTRGYVTVWVGRPDTESKRVLAIASSGPDSAFLKHAPITWDDTPFGRGPTGTAIRERRTVVFDDIAHDPRFAPWRDIVVATGSASVASIPILHGERLFGVLTIKADRPSAFDAEEISLMTGLAADVARVLQSFEDESLRRLSEAQLRKLSLAIEQSPVSVVITDPKGLIEYVNPKFTETSGYTFAEVRGQNPRVLKAGNQPPEFYRQLWQTITAGHEWHGEFQNRKKSGEIYWETVSISPITDNEGRITGYVAVKDDITRDKLAEEQILAQAGMLNLAHDAISIRDLDDRITYWNRSAERIFGWSRSEVMGRIRQDILHLDSYKASEARRQLLAEGYWTGETIARTKDGRELLLETSCTLVRDSQDQPQSILAFSRDISRQRKLENQVAHTQRIESLGTLASGVAHDLNNILTPIMVSVGLLKEQTTDPTLGKLIASLEASTKRGAQIVQQILTFGRGLRGERIPFSLLQVAREVQQLARETFPKSIQVEVTAPNNLWMVIGDPTQVHQVLLNLAINSRDAMPDGGKLTFQMENHVMDQIYADLNPEARPGPHILIQATDTGTGISPDIIGRIFDPFYTTKPPGQGTGLGLSTTLGIVKSHGGFIQVESQPGRGTNFKIYLPAKDIMPAAPVTPEPPGGKLRGRNELILFVDDEQTICSTVKKTLERFGYRILTAANGAEGVALYQVQGADIAAIITDMNMPVMDGPTMILALQAINPRVKIIGSSGMTGSELVIKATRAGVRHFIPKPYTADEMLRTLREILDQDAGPVSGAASGGKG